MSTYLSEPFTATSLVELSIRRLGERTCVINVGTDLRHVELPVVDEAVRELMHDEARVVADLERLAGSDGWELHPSTTYALRALLSAPIAG